MNEWTMAAAAGAGFGLQTAAGAVPLAGVSIDAAMDGPCLRVAVRQRYRNTEAVPVEAVYVFPLPEDAAVCGFRARFGDERVDGRVQPRDKAFETYDDALLDGRMAALLDQERPNVFTASLGNLPPGQEAVVELCYVARLRPEGDRYRLTFPTTVSPRYVPAQAPEVGQPDAERVNPERWLAVPYGLQFALRVGRCGLRCVESPSHAVRVTLDDRGADVTLAQESVALDRDLVVLVQPKASLAPSALAVPSPEGGETVLLDFLPDLPRAEHAPCEVVFLLDCSGSMGGTSIEAARRALQLCVRALYLGDTFDLVRFGSTHESLWPVPVTFDDATLAQASAWLDATDADLGGTEILAPLAFILGRPVSAGRSRSVVLLTDGQVSNEAAVIELAARHASTTTIFAFGIGAGASDHLVRGVARAGRGEAEMIFPGERIEPKVVRTFARLRSPRFADVRIETGDAEAQLAPRVLAPLFADSPYAVLARFPSRTPELLTLAAGEHRWEVPVRRATGARAEGGEIASIALCWARERIRDLEASHNEGSLQSRPGREERRRAELVALGETYGLLSSETSYVAVSSRVVAAGQGAELRNVPVALTAGWGRGRPVQTLLCSPSLRKSGLAAFRSSGMSALDIQSLRVLCVEVIATGEHEVSNEEVFGKDDVSYEELVGEDDGSHEEFFADRASSPDAVTSSPRQGDATDDAASRLERLHALLMSQGADGLFPWSDALAAELGELARPALALRDDRAATTVLVLTLLRKRFGDAEESQLAIRKALDALGALESGKAYERADYVIAAL